MGADAMAGERIEIDLAAPPHAVYEAIATADGAVAWSCVGQTSPTSARPTTRLLPRHRIACVGGKTGGDHRGV
jgi:hypothetical protein